MQLALQGGGNCRSLTHLKSPRRQGWMESLQIEFHVVYRASAMILSKFRMLGTRNPGRNSDASQFGRQRATSAVKSVSGTRQFDGLQCHLTCSS